MGGCGKDADKQPLTRGVGSELEIIDDAMLGMNRMLDDRYRSGDKKKHQITES